MMPQRANLHIALTFLQFCYAGNHIFLRIALDTGVSKLIFPVHRNITALVLLGPLAYFSEKKDRPSITRYCVLHFFLLGLVGITMKEGFYLLGLEKTSPTFAAAMQNSVPALTFLMAALLRQYESVHFNRIDGLAKVLGVLASVGGASIITLYKGPVIYTPRLALHQEQYLSVLGDATGKNWNLGGIYLFGHSLCWSGWIVMQAFVLKKYSAPLTVSAFTCFFGVVQFLTIAAFFETDSKAWQFNSSGEIFSALFSGLVTSGLASAIQIWTIGKGGPVLASIYLPLQTLLVSVMASFIFGEEFFLGGIIGAFLIISGLYLVVWGRSQETKYAKEVIVPIEPKNHWEEKISVLVLASVAMEAESDTKQQQTMEGSYSQTMQIDPKRARFPCSVVWSPLPVISWFIPCIGHIGICREDGVILDFAGPNFVCVDNFAFGAATRYIQIPKEKCCVPLVQSVYNGEEHYIQDETKGDLRTWDDALRKSTQEFQHLSYNLFTCNCHSYVANNLNRLGFLSGGWNVVNLAIFVLFNGRWVSKTSMLRSILPFVVIFFLGVLFGGFTFLKFWFFFTSILIGWFLLVTYCFKNLIQL
ncbi:Auxin-induced protein 5NG4 [Glycine soja]|nr:Auxin-induced protein 5NG4 [Glycine soja]